MNLYYESNQIVTGFEGVLTLTLSKNELTGKNYIYTFELTDKISNHIFDVHSRCDIVFHLKNIQKIIGYKPKVFNSELIEMLVVGKIDFLHFTDGLGVDIQLAHKKVIKEILKISDTKFIVNMKSLAFISMEEA